MLMPTHEILSARRSGMSSRRVAIIGGVALLHVAVVYAIVTGMAGAVLTAVPKIMEAQVIVPQAQPKSEPVPPKPILKTVDVPTAVSIPKPDIAIDNSQPTPLNVQTAPTDTPPPADTAASSVGSTHTIPPYPIEARTAGHQGTVLLTLTISPQGDVVAAGVLQSSGFPELDQSAIAWVTSHWKYKPAVQGGAPVTSQARAAVRFDLHQAHG